MREHRYIVALGSNMRHGRYGSPRGVVCAALEALSSKTGTVQARSALIETLPVGPSRRRYINAAALVASDLLPPDMLNALLEIEAEFGRKRRGQTWQARILDLDLILWDGGAWAQDDGETCLVLPHPLYRKRGFVLGPVAQIAPHWRDPLTGLTTRQAFTRLTKPLHTPR